MLSLAIHHNICLTHQERHDLHEGKDLKVVGVCVPVWFISKRTSEPAKEVFCNYYLRNTKLNVPIKILDDGYDITLPYRQGTELDIGDEEWRQLSCEDPEKLTTMYKDIIPEISSRNLLDVKEGGAGYLMYREHNKVKKEDSILTIMHYVTINNKEDFLESLELFRTIS